MKELPKNQAALPAMALPSTPGPVISSRRKKEIVSSTLSQPIQATSQAQRLVGRAAAGLGKRAAGFVTCEVKTTYEVDAQGQRTLKNQVVTRKQNPPDLAAIIFTLTNLEGDKWRMKPGTGDDPGALPPAQGLPSALAPLPDEVLRGLLNYFPQQPDKTAQITEEP